MSSRIRHFTGIAAALACALFGLAALAPASFAASGSFPPDGGGPASAGQPVHTVIVGGMPGWQIVLIAAGAAVLAATVAVLLDRARPRRRHRLSQAA